MENLCINSETSDPKSGPFKTTSMNELNEPTGPVNSSDSDGTTMINDISG